jgi:O-antigen ligase
MLAATLQFSVSSGGMNSFLPFEIHAGLFANTNHFATLLFVSIPLLIYVGIFMDRLLVSGVALAFTLLMLLAAGSRSGVLIGVAITVLSIAFLSWRSRVGGLTVAALFILVGAFSFGILSKIDLEQVDPAFGRMEFARTTIEGIRENWLWGVGYGNFDRAYQMYESSEMIFRAYVNHAHNDYLEVVFEGGIAGAALLLFYLSAFLLRYRKVASEPLQRAVFLSILFILLHSLVDYPLRTEALAVTFAFLNGIYFYQLPIERRLRRSEAMVVEHNGKSLLVPIGSSERS